MTWISETELLIQGTANGKGKRAGGYKGQTDHQEDSPVFYILSIKGLH